MQLEQLLALSRTTRAAAAAACLRARTYVAAARSTTQASAEGRIRRQAPARPRKRRVLVYLPDTVELARICRELAGLDCEVFATTELSRAAREIASDRAIDLLVTPETFADRGRPVLLH